VGIIYEDKRYTWQDINARVNGLANGLLALGLNKQDRVAILCRNCNQYLEFYFATAKAGLVAVPLNTWFIGKELSYLINSSGARALIVDENYLNIAETLKVDTVEHYIGFGNKHPYTHDLETLIRESLEEEPRVEIDEDDLFALSYTSGTTGTPKEAMITHKNSIAATWRMALELRIEPHSVYVLHAPMFFAAGGGGRFPCILTGCKVIIMAYEAGAFLRTIEKERVTHFTGSPTPIKRLVDHPEVTKYDLSSVRVIGLTGAPHSIAEIRSIEKVFGHVWYSSWGMTETCACGTMLQPEEVEVKGPLSKRMTSVGKAQIGLEVSAVDEHGDEIPHNGKDVGELVVRGDIVMKGYWNAPEETVNSMKDGWLGTGDMVTIDEEGYIYIVDRKKDLIISGGINISAREIEEVIYTHPAVAHCAVIGVPDEKWGETPKAVVVLKKGMKAAEDEIIELCRQNLASYKKPTSVDFVDSLPLTPTGKILKREVKEEYRRRFEKGTR
jgi:acyl-CoA synthetase (AMP-forming)/AMP-acid ligase II